MTGQGIKLLPKHQRINNRPRPPLRPSCNRFCLHIRTKLLDHALFHSLGKPVRADISNVPGAVAQAVLLKHLAMQLVQVQRNSLELHLRMLLPVDLNLLSQRIFKIGKFSNRDAQKCTRHSYLFSGTPSRSFEIYAASTVRIVSMASSTLVGSVGASPVT